MESIHQRIKRLRISKGMTLEDLAKRVDVSWQTVQQWEREDGTAPKRGRHQVVADVFGISVAELVTGEESTESGLSVAKAYDFTKQEIELQETRDIAAAYAGAPEEVRRTIQMILRMTSADTPVRDDKSGESIGEKSEPTRDSANKPDLSTSTILPSTQVAGVPGLSVRGIVVVREHTAPKRRKSDER